MRKVGLFSDAWNPTCSVVVLLRLVLDEKSITAEPVIDKMSQFMYEEYGIQIKKEDFEFEYHDL